jgi:hypothetical protein
MTVLRNRGEHACHGDYYPMHNHAEKRIRDTSNPSGRICIVPWYMYSYALSHVLCLAGPPAGMKNGPRFHQKRHQSPRCRRMFDTDIKNTALAPAVLLARL